MYVNFEELNFDATDADTLKRYLGAMKVVSERANSMDAESELPEQYRSLCESVKTCFDDIFGTGTGEKICGANNSLKVCTNAFKELVDEYNHQMCEQDKANKALLSTMGAAGLEDADIAIVDGKAVDVE